MTILFLILCCMVISSESHAEVRGFHPIMTIKNTIIEEGYNLFNTLKRVSHLIYPGTNFCGAGNVSQRFDDLGESEVDVCCRAHDYCTQYIEPKKRNFNLTNDGLFSCVNCDCDEAFNACLKSINNKASKIIGNIYFNILGRSKRCFKKDYPVVRCVYYVLKYLNLRCIKYKYDTSKTKMYQWFDLPIFE